MSNSAVNKKQPLVQVTVKDLRRFKILCEAPEHFFFPQLWKIKSPEQNGKVTEQSSWNNVIFPLYSIGTVILAQAHVPGGRYRLENGHVI